MDSGGLLALCMPVVMLNCNVFHETAHTQMIISLQK